MGFELNRLRFSLVLGPLALWLAYAALASDAKPTLLVVGPGSANFEKAIESLRFEVSAEGVSGISGDFQVKRLVIANLAANPERHDEEYKRLSTSLDEIKPAVLVLMDNSTVDLYRRYQNEFRNDRPFPPTIVAMAINIVKAIEGLEDTVGIRYEISAAISLRDLRNVIRDPIRRVGVIYREEFQDYFQEQKADAAREKIELVGYRIDEDEKNVHRRLRRGLRYLTQREEVDALWLINDNKLLTAETVKNVWIPSLDGYRKPIVVGVRSLVEIGFGHFAEWPDHNEIGNMIADWALEISQTDWQVEEGEVRKLYSVEKIIRKDFARRHFGLIEENLGEIDHIVD